MTHFKNKLIGWQDVSCRWKGENVSTTEVSNILTDLDFVHDASVYGVSVPGECFPSCLHTLFDFILYHYVTWIKIFKSVVYEFVVAAL